MFSENSVFAFAIAAAWLAAPLDASSQCVPAQGLVIPAPMVQVRSVGVAAQPCAVGVLHGGRAPFDPILTAHSSSPSGVFNSGVIFLADQIDRNVHPDVRKRPTVITSFANLNDLNESSNLGRLVGESLMHELQVRNWTVTDIRLTKDLIINDSGEFSLSRDIKFLRENFPVSNVVTGTYSTTSDGVILNIRVIDSANGRIVSTAQTRFLRDGFVAGLVDRPVVYPVVTLRRACPTSSPCEPPNAKP